MDPLFDAPESPQEEGWDDDPRDDEDEPQLVEYEEPVDTSTYVAVIHDSFGERYVNVPMLQQRGGAITVLRILGAMSLEARGEVQYFLDGNVVGPDHLVSAGQSVYIVGKIAGGK